MRLRPRMKLAFAERRTDRKLPVPALWPTRAAVA